MRAKEMTRNRWFGVAFFALYILLLFYILFFSELNGRGLMNRDHISYNMHPFREIYRYLFYWKQIGLLNALLNLFGNIIGFVPLGSCDVDDIILNTLGTALGYLCFLFVQLGRSKRREKKNLR